MKKAFLLFFLIVSQIPTQAQLVDAIARNRYKNLNYSGAIPLLEARYQKDSNRVDVIAMLANAHRLVNNTQQASYYYGRWVQFDASSAVSIQYAQLLLSTGQYDLLHLFLYSDKIKSNTSLEFETLRTQLPHLALLNSEDEAFVTTTFLAFNDEEPAFAPMLWGNSIVYASSQTKRGTVNRRHSWTNRAFLKPQVSRADAQYSRSQSFLKIPKHRYNVVAGSFAVDGDSSLFYTTNIRHNRKKSKFNQLQLLQASWSASQNKWIEPELFEHNLADHASTHPHLSADGKLLFFSSNRPGGFGGMDLYFCRQLSTGQWSHPQNLGPHINSSADELFPFLTHDQKFYFSSSGWGSLGGLDIFEGDLSDSLATPWNLGTPINSAADDFAFIVEKDLAQGYFSSNRKNKGLDDDLYAFKGFKPRLKSILLVAIDSATSEVISQVMLRIHPDSSAQLLAQGSTHLSLIPGNTYTFLAEAPNYKPTQKEVVLSKIDSVIYITMSELQREFVVEGVILDKITAAPLDNVQLTITNKNSGLLLIKLLTNASGRYRYISLPANQQFDVLVTRSGYFAQNAVIQTTRSKSLGLEKKEQLINFSLEPIIIGKAFKIDNIYFDFNKWNIRKDAAKELDKIVKILVDNPEIVIELSSHTDARGNDASNMLLSERRATASVTYIISKGIDPTRISAKGYGESLLTNRCGNGVKCTEKEHQENRRTEFRVVGYL